MATRKKNTYSHYKGKAFVAAQIRRRRMLMWYKADPKGSPMGPDAIEYHYESDIRSAKMYAKRMAHVFGRTIEE